MRQKNIEEWITLITKDESGIRTRFSGELEYGISFVCNYDAEYYKDNYKFFQDFKSGNKILDDVLHRELHRHNECITFLFYQSGDDVPIAFCSMCCSSLYKEELIAGKTNKIMHPAIEFRYFAVREDKQNTFVCSDVTEGKTSSYIFNQCMYYAYILSTNVVAAEYFILHALNEKKVVAFYKRHGFTELSDDIGVATDITLQDNCVPVYMLINKSSKWNSDDTAVIEC